MPARCFFCWKRPKRKKENIYAFVSMLMDHNNLGNTLWSKSKNHNEKMSWYELWCRFVLKQFRLESAQSSNQTNSRCTSVYPVQAALRGLLAHPISISFDQKMWWAAAWTSVCPVSPSESMASQFRACLRTSTLMAFSSQWRASLLGSSQCFTEAHQHSMIRVIVFVLHEACFIFVF